MMNNSDLLGKLNLADKMLVGVQALDHHLVTEGSSSLLK